MILKNNIYYKMKKKKGRKEERKERKGRKKKVINISYCWDGEKMGIKT